MYYHIAMEIGHHAWALGLGLVGFLFILYMLDADEWSGWWSRIFLGISVLLIICSLVMLVLLIADGESFTL